MKKVIALLLVVFIAFALVGCNIAPNVPRVTPYRTNGVIPNNPNSSTGYVPYTGTTRNNTYTGTNRNGTFNGTNGTGTYNGMNGTYNGR